jgi:formate/nitrite transporter FocA (FNT family)
MAGADPADIWDAGVEEGERRLSRSVAGLLATGLVGGVDIMLGILALTVTAGAMTLVMPTETAHVIGSLTFGIGLAFLIVGRSELFTENFLVPVSAVFHGRARWPRLLRLWLGTLVGNLVSLFILAAIFVRAGLVPPEALDTASELAETLAQRDFVSALLSAVVAGTLMTLLTWLAHAATTDGARLAIAMLIGFVLAAPSLNHAVVSFGEMSFGILADRGSADWDDLGQNFPVAVLGNLLGGLSFVTIVRLVQVRGEESA